MIRHMRHLLGASVMLAVTSQSLLAQGQAMPVAEQFKSLHFRSIGPATMSGRIADLAVYEANPAIYYVAHRARRRVEDHEQRRDVHPSVPGCRG